MKKFRLDALGTPGTTLSQMDACRGVTANALDPGWVRTEMGAQFEGPALQRSLMSTVNRLFGVSHQKGSEQYLNVACDPALPEKGGRYFARGREKGSSLLTHDAELARSIEDTPRPGSSPLPRRHHRRGMKWRRLGLDDDTLYQRCGLA